MAGLSSRFSDAGYDKPKFMLEAHGKSLFEHSVSSFSHYFSSEEFLFITLSDHDAIEFVGEICKKIGIRTFQIVTLEKQTNGQAETVYTGLQLANVPAKSDITIFNIDTIRPNFRYPTSFCVSDVDGYLETFIGSGLNWSNILAVSDSKDDVSFVAEKKEISNFCCTGLYYWKSVQQFCAVYDKYRGQSVEQLDGGEYYIAPMYNDVIQRNGVVKYSVIDRADIVFCGLPSEYEEFLRLSYFKY